MGQPADVIVVGAGIAGAATAYYLARQGQRVLLLEAERPAFGASGRNPGFLWLQTKQAGAQMAFALAGRAFAGQLADEIGDFDFRESGGLIVYRDERLSPVANAFVADRRAAGLAVEHIDRNDLLSLCPALGPAVIGGVYNPLDAYQDTGRLVARLVGLAVEKGAVLRAPASVAQLWITGGRCQGVVLRDGETIGSAQVVVAAGPGATPLLASHGLAPLWTTYRFEAAETAPAHLGIKPVICGQALFRFFTPKSVDADVVASLVQHPIEAQGPTLGFTEQIAQGADGRLRFGCAFATNTESAVSTVKGQALANAILPETIPALAGLALERSWAGIVASPADGLPIVDAAPGIDGLALNIGHFFGNLAGAFSGSLLADALLGRTPAFGLDAFAVHRPGVLASQTIRL
jgi:glycine/D-amino acid oxidase-like deaminating enzyme